jgi:hypothetical protein
MEILAIKTGPIEKLHQPVDHIAGAMSSEMITALTKACPFVA